MCVYGFDGLTCGDKLGLLHVHKSKHGRPRKKKKILKKKKKIEGLCYRLLVWANYKSRRDWRFVGMTFDCKLKFKEYATMCYF